jgi:hypothetical protein
MKPALQPVSFKKPVVPQPRLSKPYEPGRRDKRYWTEAEDAVVRQHYPTGGAAACLPGLPNRGIGAVYQRAGKLGLKGQHYSPAGRKRREYPADIDDRIREAWPTLQGKGATNAWADEIGLPRWWLTKRATALGLTKAHKKEPPWTQTEIDLMHKVPLHDPMRCSRIFREHGFSRSPTAITVKAKRIDLSRRYRATLSATSTAKILGIDAKTFTRMILTGEIPAEKRQTQRLPQQGGDPWSIKREDLRAYIIEHLERIDIRKVEKFAFVDLLVNTAPAPDQEVK